jgi:monofunctional biosynthetic peptidoglycan transglycosylase
MMRTHYVKLAIYGLIGLWWFVSFSGAISTPKVIYLRWHIPWETAYMKASESVPVHRYVSMKKISPYLQRAVIAAEDDRFREHEGVDWDAVKRAYEINVKRKRISHGASTISMQLARNLYLSSQKSPLRKFKEILIAMKLERELPKERILEIYLNVVEWGDGIFGAEAAAKHYFGKSAAALTPHEAAFLAAILPRPKFYDKHRGGPHLQRRIGLIESIM